MGVLIEGARGSESVRSAARRAEVDDALWRQVERGYRPVGDATVVANPRDVNLESIATAVGLDPAKVFAAAGRDYKPRAARPPDRLTAVEERLDRIEAAVAQLLERADP